MKRTVSLLLTAFLSVSCGLLERRREAPPESNDRLAELKTLYAAKLAEAAALRDPATGWLARNDCDGMIWAGQYAAATSVVGVDIGAAEYPERSGRFSRRPFPSCWTPEGGDQGSKTTWSRDMFVGGLLPYAWYNGNRDVLERHAAYGREHNWQMGEPLADGRAVYTPALIGLLYKSIEALGGDYNVNSAWPDVYPSGLTDYEAHLQAMSILLHGEVAAKLTDAALALDISNTMFERIVGHAEREPSEPLFAYILAKYDGKATHVLDLLLDPAMPMAGFVRCEVEAECKLAHWLFVASRTIEWMDAHGQ